MNDFRLLWTAGLATGLGGQFAGLALPLAVLATTGSATSAGLVASVTVAAMVLAAVPGGALADRRERRSLMLACDTAGLVGSLLLSWLIARGAVILPLVLVLAAVSAAAASVHAPAAAALVRAVVPAGRLGRAIAQLQTRTSAARLAGPLLGGLLYAVDPLWPFLVQAAGHLVALLCVIALRTRSTPPETGHTGAGPWRALFAGFALVWRRPELRTPLLVFGCLLNVAFGAVTLVTLTTAAHADPTGRLAGLVSATTAGGTLLGGLLATRLPVQRHLRTLIILTCWVTTGTVAALAITPPALTGVLLGGCLAVAALGNVAFATLLLRDAPEQLVGRVQAAATVVSMAAQPIGPVLGGLLHQRLGPTLTLLLLAGACLVAALIAGVTPRFQELPPEREAHPLG
ncbi:MFS transporter [Actinoplanes sp. NPDC026670]|uniref:MFS transporter n=1 Tax=Actinoplanes sp. NPDC026670 TaxID=3154700 RepID=UPI0033EDAC4A